MMADRPKILLWGTADFGKPRSRILRQGLQEEGVLVGECVIDVWGGVDDKSQVKGLWAHLRLIIKWVCAYPILVWKYMRAPRHDIVFVAYLGHFDVLILWPFAKMRGAMIVWDAFLSLYDTIVCDRKLVPIGSLRAWCIRKFEGLVCAAADVIVLDTRVHGDYFQHQYLIPSNKLVSAFVGVEDDIFQCQKISKLNQMAGKCRVLFYGQFIPLHGIEFIIEAARQTIDSSIEWVIIGHGQETEKIQALIEDDNITSVSFIDWVEYEQLPDTIAKADICLGVFGKSDKAARVIPNKVFQIIAVGRPLITLECPAISELISSNTPGVWLVPAGSSEAIARAVEDAKNWLWEGDQELLYEGLRAAISPKTIAQILIQSLTEAYEGRC